MSIEQTAFSLLVIACIAGYMWHIWSLIDGICQLRRIKKKLNLVKSVYDWKETP